jgi:hypothetical protein
MKLNSDIIIVLVPFIGLLVLIVGGLVVEYKSLEVRENACQQCCEEVKR